MLLANDLTTYQHNLQNTLQFYLTKPLSSSTNSISSNSSANSSNNNNNTNDTNESLNNFLNTSNVSNFHDINLNNPTTTTSTTNTNNETNQNSNEQQFLPVQIKIIADPNDSHFNVNLNEFFFSLFILITKIIIFCNF